MHGRTTSEADQFAFPLKFVGRLISAERSFAAHNCI
jgi:hypothetical protein